MEESMPKFIEFLEELKATPSPKKLSKIVKSYF